jgi:beta-phosphoglucomutase
VTESTKPWAVLWDLDGTLVDTAELHFQAWVALAAELQMPFTRDDFAGTFGWRNPEIIPKLFGEHDERKIAELGDHKEDLYRAEAEKGVALLPGAFALLQAVVAMKGQQAIGSSAPRRNIDLILRMTQTAAIFSAIVAMEDTHRGKPDPQVFLMGAQKLGIAPDRCIVMEDAPVGIHAAKAAGMRAVGVTFVGHHPMEKLRAAGADLVVPCLTEITVKTLRALLALAA